MKRMSETDRKSPEMLAIKSKREPLSTRVKSESKKVLKSAAREAKTSVSDLTAAIIDDYCEWLETQKETARR
jgi:hypothetical protein